MGSTSRIQFLFCVAGIMVSKRLGNCTQWQKIYDGCVASKGGPTKASNLTCREAIYQV
jgi:hypothetical protein